MFAEFVRKRGLGRNEMTFTRRQILILGLPLSGLIAVGAYIPLRIFTRPSPYDKAVQVWMHRLRPSPELAAASASHFGSRHEAEDRLNRDVGAELSDGTVQEWVKAIQTVRSRQFAAGEIIYLDGWPFAPVEIALMSLVVKG